MFSFPFEMSLVILLATTSLLLALLTFVFLLANRARRTIKRLRFQQTRYLGIGQHVFRFSITFFWIAVSAAVLFLAAFIQSYRNFTKEELVAEVRCVPVQGDGAVTMHLELIPVSAGQRLSPRVFLLNGDQWALEGDILKWDDWLNFAGIHTMYKLTRVRGRYVDFEDEMNQKRSVFSLVEREDDPRWRWLYKYGHRLRFVDAVYGNTVYTYPLQDNAFEVYVSTSGFTVKIK
ncbi:MAG TPA: hypothetical protein VGA99_06960 [bacterium]